MIIDERVRKNYEVVKFVKELCDCGGKREEGELQKRGGLVVVAGIFESSAAPLR